MKADGVTPAAFKPKCIVVKPLQGVALNAVGLSGPGAEFLFKTGKWQQRTEPFAISFMAVEHDAGLRLNELAEFLSLLARHLKDFKAPVALQINFSCPNVEHKHETEELVREVIKFLELCYLVVDVPIIPKFNILLPPEAAAEISKHPACRAINVSNTIPWGELPQKIDWQRLFGTLESPLKEFGGGGLSGAPLLPLVADWVIRAKTRAKVSKPIIAGGGILKKSDAKVMFDCGAQAVAIGSVSMLRPWRVQGIIDYANQIAPSAIW
jgi:dihydroorotate dehydrogenase